MVSHLSRRRVLAGCGALAGSVLVSQRVIDRASKIGAPSQNNDTFDWPMEQHDSGGTSYAPDARPPKDGVRVRWKHQIQRSLSVRPSPIVANGLVYGVGDDLICIDTASGHVVFRINREFNTPPAVTHARAYQSPTLVFGTTSGAVGLHARGGIAVGSNRIGLIRWKTSWKDGLFTVGMTRKRPVAVDGTVFVTGGGHLHAIDGSSGRLRWQTPSGADRPVIHDGTVYVADYQRGVIGYDTTTGEQTRSIERLGAISVTATTDGLIVTDSARLYGLDYDGTVRWEYEYAPVDWSIEEGSLAVADGVAYTWSSDGILAINATDGTELWQNKAIQMAAPRSAPIAVADGIVYVPANRHGLTAIDTTDGHVRWRFTLDSKHMRWSPVALAGRTLYVLGNGTLYALEER